MREIIRFLKTEAWPENSFAIPKLQAHRGYWLSGARENTIASFREAKRRGAEIFEFDVRLSKDNIPVVFHDPKLDRLAKFPKSVEEMTAEELQNLVGAPLLETVLQDSEVPRYFNIEIKSQTRLSRPIERKVVELVRKYNLERRVLFSTFNPVYIYRLSRLAPEIPRALLVTPEKNPGNFVFVRRLWLAPWLKFHLLHLEKSMLSPIAMEQLAKRKVPVAVWTVNEPDEIKKFLDWGCVSVISDSLGLV